MKKIKIVCVLIILLLLVGITVYMLNNNHNELANINEIKTDPKFENVTYDKVEDLWDISVLGVLTIEKIGLNATVKDGTTNETLTEYVGHIEETAIYDGNIGLAGHNRGNKYSYFARINELKIGDEIKYKTKFYDRTYVVDNIQVIYETDWSLLKSTENNKLTLITCITNRKNQRLCLQATEVWSNN